MLGTMRVESELSMMLCNQCSHESNYAIFRIALRPVFLRHCRMRIAAPPMRIAAPVIQVMTNFLCSFLTRLASSCWRWDFSSSNSDSALGGSTFTWTIRIGASSDEGSETDFRWSKYSSIRLSRVGKWGRLPLDWKELYYQIVTSGRMRSDYMMSGPEYVDFCSLSCDVLTNRECNTVPSAVTTSKASIITREHKKTIWIEIFRSRLWSVDFICDQPSR